MYLVVRQLPLAPAREAYARVLRERLPQGGGDHAGETPTREIHPASAGVAPKIDHATGLHAIVSLKARRVALDSNANLLGMDGISGVEKYTCTQADCR